MTDGATSRSPGVDGGEQVAVHVLQHAAAEQHLDRLVRQAETGQSDTRERNNLQCEALDDLRGDRIVRRFREDDRRELDHAALLDLPVWIASASSVGVVRPK